MDHMDFEEEVVEEGRQSRTQTTISYVDKILLQTYKRRLRLFRNKYEFHEVDSIETDKESSVFDDKEAEFEQKYLLTRTIENLKKPKMYSSAKSDASSLSSAGTRSTSVQSVPPAVNNRHHVDKRKKPLEKREIKPKLLTKTKSEAVAKTTVVNGRTTKTVTKSIISRSQSENREKNATPTRSRNAVNNTPVEQEQTNHKKTEVTSDKDNRTQSASAAKITDEHLLILQQTLDEWEILDKELHDAHHYFTRKGEQSSGEDSPRTVYITQLANRINMVAASRQGSLQSPDQNSKRLPHPHLHPHHHEVHHNPIKHPHDHLLDARQTDEWARLDQEIHDENHEFVPPDHHEEPIPLVISTEDDNEPMMSLDSVIAAAKRRSESVSPSLMSVRREDFRSRQTSMREDTLSDTSLTDNEHEPC